MKKLIIQTEYNSVITEHVFTENINNYLIKNIVGEDYYIDVDYDNGKITVRDVCKDRITSNIGTNDISLYSNEKSAVAPYRKKPDFKYNYNIFKESGYLYSDNSCYACLENSEKNNGALGGMKFKVYEGDDDARQELYLEIINNQDKINKIAKAHGGFSLEAYNTISEYSTYFDEMRDVDIGISSIKFGDTIQLHGSNLLPMMVLVGVANNAMNYMDKKATKFIYKTSINNTKRVEDNIYHDALLWLNKDIFSEVIDVELDFVGDIDNAELGMEAFKGYLNSLMFFPKLQNLTIFVPELKTQVRIRDRLTGDIDGVAYDPNWDSNELYKHYTPEYWAGADSYYYPYMERTRKITITSSEVDGVMQRELYLNSGFECDESFIKTVLYYVDALFVDKWQTSEISNEEGETTTIYYCGESDLEGYNTFQEKSIIQGGGNFTKITGKLPLTKYNINLNDYTSFNNASFDGVDLECFVANMDVIAESEPSLTENNDANLYKYLQAGGNIDSDKNVSDWIIQEFLKSPSTSIATPEISIEKGVSASLGSRASSMTSLSVGDLNTPHVSANSFSAIGHKITKSGNDVIKNVEVNESYDDNYNPYKKAEYFPIVYDLDSLSGANNLERIKEVGLLVQKIENVATVQYASPFLSDFTESPKGNHVIPYMIEENRGDALDKYKDGMNILDASFIDAIVESIDYFENTFPSTFTNHGNTFTSLLLQDKVVAYSSEIVYERPSSVELTSGGVSEGLNLYATDDKENSFYIQISSIPAQEEGEEDIERFLSSFKSAEMQITFNGSEYSFEANQIDDFIVSGGSTREREEEDENSIIYTGGLQADGSIVYNWDNTTPINAKYFTVNGKKISLGGF